MSLAIFSVTCFILLVATYLVLRAHYRRFTCKELADRVKLLSTHAREVLWEDAQGDAEEVWLQIGDMYKAANNLTYFTFIADRFLRIMRLCTDPYCISRMQVTHRAYFLKRYQLYKTLLKTVAIYCFGRICKGRRTVYMALVARLYTDIVLLTQEMVEVVDDSCSPILEGQFLHGS